MTEVAIVAFTKYFTTLKKKYLAATIIVKLI